MEYLQTIGYNSLAYFILERLGLAKMVAESTGLTDAAGKSAKFALAYTGINEGMDILDNGRSALTQGQYFAVVDNAVWNYLFVLGINRTQLDYVIDDMLDNFKIPDGDVRIAVINGVLITVANLLRKVINTQAPKQMRILTMPSSFLYATSTGNGNVYL